jgi:hypothetical protein
MTVPWPPGDIATRARAAAGNIAGHVEPPDFALQERDRRSEANAARDFTATFCGDPPKSFSALDQSRAARKALAS